MFYYVLNYFDDLVLFYYVLNYYDILILVTNPPITQVTNKGIVISLNK